MLAGEHSVSALAQGYDMSFAAVQKHVAVLERAGLLTKRRQGREALASGDVEAVRSVGLMLTELEDGRAAALQLVGEPGIGKTRLLAELAARHRLPTTSIFPHYADAGLLMSYGPNLYGLFSQAATYVDKILKGAKPGELAIGQPSHDELIVNRNAARVIGLNLTQDLLKRADKVIG